jgi:hypothetical protein
VGARFNASHRSFAAHQLGGKKRVTVREFKGKVLVDIREFYEANSQMLPGKKGWSAV